MKIETERRLNYERRDCKFAYAGKWKLQIGLVVKVEIASMLNYEIRNFKYA